MSLSQLAWRNIAGSLFRSTVVLLCAALMAGFALGATMLVQGAQRSLRLSLERLGADVILISRGINTDLIESARLMTTPSKSWLPFSALPTIVSVPGVAGASPQLFLATVDGSSCCSLERLHLIAFDPATDFTVRPWLLDPIEGLAVGEALAGSKVQLANEASVVFFGYSLHLRGHLASTGTVLDEALFVSFETAAEMALASGGQLDMAPASMSAALVRVRLDSDPHEVAVRLMEAVPNAISVESDHFFQVERRQMVGLLRTVLALLFTVWALALAVTTLVFALAVNERRRHLAVLRALGANRSFLLRSLLLEGALLGLSGGILGAFVSLTAILLLHGSLVQSLGLPLALPEPETGFLLALGSLCLALASVTLAALLPAWRFSRNEPALAMRE